MCVNNLTKVALDSAAAGIEPATSSRKSNALTSVPPSHNLLHLTSTYVFKFYIDIVDMCTYCKGCMLLELLMCSFRFEQPYVRDRL